MMNNSMTDIYLHDPVYALGSVAQSLEEAGANGQLISAASELRQAGFNRHRICAHDETAYDLALRTASQLGHKLEGTSAIIYATCLPQNANMGSAKSYAATRDVKHLMTFPASQLQADLGLPSAITFGLNQQACTGMLGSVRLARALLIAEPEMRKVLCVTADRFPEDALYEQAYNLISDGGAGWLVSRERRGYRLLAAHQITNGALATADDDQTVGSFFNHTSLLVRETVARAGIPLEEIDWIVPQNMNLSAWTIMARILGIPEARVFTETCPQVGHVIGGDNVINLRHLEASGKVIAGQRLALVMAGFGMHWQCLILERV